MEIKLIVCVFSIHSIGWFLHIKMQNWTKSICLHDAIRLFEQYYAKATIRFFASIQWLPLTLAKKYGPRIKLHFCLDLFALCTLSHLSEVAFYEDCGLAGLYAKTQTGK